MNLDAYFERIGWRGPRVPSHEVLGGIVAHHMQAIPFENLDVLLGRPPRLELEHLEHKLVQARRGGYCYEHATLVAAVLTELGFTVKTHSARVGMITPRSASPRTHMFLTVESMTRGGDWMIDPGFGGRAPRVPVALDGTAAGPYRLVRDGAARALERRSREDQDDGRERLALELDGQRLWVSTFEHDLPIDFEMANHFTATHPASHFTRLLMMRAFVPDGQVRVRNRDVTVIRGDDTQMYQLADRAALRALVVEHFGFDLPELEQLRVPQIPEWE